LALLMLAGCGNVPPEVAWGQSQNGYNDILRTVKEYRAPCVASVEWPDGGPDHPLCRIDDDLYRKIETVRTEVDGALKDWRRALDSGNTIGADFYLGRIETGLERLRRYLAQAEMED